MRLLPWGRGAVGSGDNLPRPPAARNEPRGPAPGPPGEPPRPNAGPAALAVAIGALLAALPSAGVAAARTATVDTPVPQTAGPPAPRTATADTLTPRTPPPCPTDPEAAADLHCVEMYRAAGIPRGAGTLELLPPATPFGIAVGPAGAIEHRLALTLEELPDPSSLGPYRAYVAWATTPRLRPMVRLGTVREGRNELGSVAFNRFLVLVTAERDPATEERDGRLVLRGASPSLRLHPHDFGAYLSTAAAGRTADPAGRPAGEPADDSAGRDAPTDAGDGADADRDADPDASGRDVGWRVPPVPAEVQPVPGLSSLRPSVGPFLPDFDPGRLPRARPSRVVRLADGDTLRLEARPVRREVAGRTFVGYGFNGRVPGPLIRVDRGAEIVVLFRNGIDLPTTVHWHGIRLDNAFDGVPHVTQEPVPPGGRFTYRVRFPDAGLYWYHPHLREDIQQDLGLYGNLRVDPPAPGWFGPANREEVLVLDDLLLGTEGPIPWGRQAATHAMMGRFGNVFLVNGEPDWRLRVRPGAVVRLFLTNVANTRVFHLGLGDAELKAVATDMGRFPSEERVEGVVLAPAERFVVEARFPEAGRYALTNRVQGIDHQFGAFYPDVDTLGVVEVAGDPLPPQEDHRESFRRLRTHDSLLARVRGLRAWRDRPPDHRLTLTIEAEGLPFPVEPMMRADSLYFPPVEWTGSMPMSNWVSTGEQVRWILRDPDTGRENMAIGWRFAVGDTVKLKLLNDRNAFHAMQHPIHLHGQRFLVLSRDGVPNPNPAWKDTFLLPVGSTAELLVELTNPGRWMLHCHIAEHRESGMKTVITVDPTNSDRGDVR